MPDPHPIVTDRIAHALRERIEAKPVMVKRGGELVWTTQMMRVWHDADGWHEEPVTAETED